MPLYEIPTQRLFRLKRALEESQRALEARRQPFLARPGDPRAGTYRPQRVREQEGGLIRPGGMLSRSLEPLAPESVTTPIAETIGKGARLATETGLAGQAAADVLGPLSPQFTIAGQRFEPVRHGFIPTGAGEALQQAVTEEGQRIIPSLTSPLGLAATAAFPAATAFGTAGAAAGGIAGRLAEEAGFDPRLQAGPFNIGPRAAGELVGGLYAGPGRAVRAPATAPETRLDDLLAAARRRTVREAEFPAPVPVGMNRAALLDENRTLKTLVQEGRATPEQETRLTQVRAELQGAEQATSTGSMQGFEGRLAGEGPSEAANVPLSAKDEAFDSLERVLVRQPEDWAATLEQRSSALSQRVAEAERLKERFISEGMSVPDALRRSESALRGEMPVTQAIGLDFTPRAEAWLWDRVLTDLQPLEQRNVADMFAKLANDPTRVIRPFEKELLIKSAGPEFAERLEQAMKARSGALGAVEEAKKLAGPPAPGVGGMGPALPNVGTQRVFAEVAPEVIPPPGAKLSQVLPEREPYIFDYIADSLGLPRAIMSSGDLSFYRQISKTVGRHPLLSVEAGKKASQAALSEPTAIKFMDELASEGVKGNPGYIQRVQTPEGLREIGLGDLLKPRYMAVPGTPGYAEAGLMARPEFYVSRLSEKLPIVRQSGRGFAIGTNLQMQGVDRYWLQRFTKMNGGALTPKQVDDILNLTERLVGRGELGQSWFARFLKAVGFAPGYRISGPQSFANLLNVKNPQMMRMAAEELFTWATLGSSMLTALKYGAGASVVLELGSPHFGRIQFPGSDTYYNIWGTDQVLARTIIQAIKKQKVDEFGNITPLGNRKGGLTGYLTAAKDAFWQYARSGEDPIVGLITDLSAGETYLGKPLKWNPESVFQLVKDRIPMAAGDLIEIAETDGPIQSILSAPFAFLGGGISSYKPTAAEFRALPMWNTASPQVTQAALPGYKGPLNLTPNEERKLSSYLGKDGEFGQFVQGLENKLGGLPEGTDRTKLLAGWAAYEKKLDERETAGLLFLYKASSHPEWYNPKWIEYAVTHEKELADRFPGTYELAIIDKARAAARKAGVIP